MIDPPATHSFRTPLICVALLAFAGCGRQEPAATAPAAGERPAAALSKIPVTTSSEEARVLFHEGRVLLDDLHFVESRPYFEQAVEKDPDFAMGYVLLANSAQNATQFFDALEKAEDKAARASAGERLIIRALAAGARNDQASQLTALNELASMHPGDERVHVLLGNFYNGQQDFRNAAKHFEHATELNSEFAGAFNSLGYARRSLDDLAGAKRAFERYVELVPDEPNPYDSYAELLMEMGSYDESIEIYRKALSIDKNFAASYAGISINESLKGDVDAALAATAEMLAVARTAGEKQGAIFRSVTSHLFAGDVDAAMAASEEMLSVARADSNHVAMGGISEYMGDIMADAGDGRKALELYDRALEHRMRADINEANKAQAKRAHLYKSAIAALVSQDRKIAKTKAAEYKLVAEAYGTAFERRRIRALSGFLAILNEDWDNASQELGRASRINPVVIYWAAVANKNAGNEEKAAELANRAANRNTLSANLPLVRAEALRLLEDLGSDQRN